MRELHFPSGRQLLVLRDIAQHPQSSAVDITARLTAVTEGSVYTTLNRLQDLELVESDKDQMSTGPGAPQRWYTATAKGRMIAALAHTYEVFLDTLPS